MAGSDQLGRGREGGILIKPDLLYISTHLPSLRVPQAGHKTAYSILSGLSMDYNITAVFFMNDLEKKYFCRDDYAFCREFFLFPVSLFSRIRGIILHPSLPLRTASRANIRAAGKIRELQERINFRTVHFEFTASGYYRQYITGKVRTVYSEHDLTYQSYERRKLLKKGLLRILYSLEYGRQKKWELGVIGKMDEIILHNDKDKAILLDDGIPENKIELIQPYVDSIFKKTNRDRIEKHSLLYWGAMNRPENRDAVLWFTEEIFPAILDKFPDSKLYIAGANPPENIKKLGSKNIEVTGFVENPLEYFEKAEAAVVPLRLGAGIKVKVLECLEAGLPVITTSVGAEGIPDMGRLIVADGKDDFIKAIISFFESSKGSRT